jgi:hypothetical protein
MLDNWRDFQYDFGNQLSEECAMNNDFNLFKLSKRETRETKGGVPTCGCGCAYANCGGSSSNDNSVANFLGGEGKGLISPHFEPQC